MNPGDQSIFDAANDQHERNMNQSNTPRTDDEEIDAGVPHPRCKVVLSSFARQLETELADAQQANGEAVKTVQRYIAELKAANERADEWKRMAEELAAVSKEYLVAFGGIAKERRNQTLAKFDQMKGKL